MLIEFAGNAFDFVPWKPAMGVVFRQLYAFDSETTLIDEARPWLTPAYVIGAAVGSGRGYFLTRETTPPFFRAHADVPVAMHHAAFDLDVVDVLAPELDIYRRVDDDLVWDTQLLHRLERLAAVGQTASRKGESTLERCSAEHLGVDLPKDVVDSRGDPVRLSYGRWLGRDPREIEPVYLEYLAKDAVATHFVYHALRRKIESHLRSGRRVWGYVSDDWLEQQVERWGPQTHHTQLKAAIVLREITANGLHLDVGRRDELLAGVRTAAEEKRAALREHGYIPGQPGSEKAIARILGQVERQGLGGGLVRTPTGKIATSQEALAPLVERVPFVRDLLEYNALSKLDSSFLGKMGRPVLHPSFDVLKTTGRTSSRGELNAQNLPRDERVRRCFVPRPGHVYADLDFAAIEMATLGQGTVSQFGLASRLADALNAGRDPHQMVAALATRKDEADVTGDDRQKAKPINFGKPGGMGDDTLKQYARSTYRVDLSDAEVRALSDAWFSLFPEMREFLRNDSDTGLEVARFFGLTPRSFYEETGSRKFLDRRESAARGDRPSPILGGMCLKALRVEAPATGAGRPYDRGELDYFWTRVAGRLEALPADRRAAVLAQALTRPLAQRPGPGRPGARVHADGPAQGRRHLRGETQQHFPGCRCGWRQARPLARLARGLPDRQLRPRRARGRAARRAGRVGRGAARGRVDGRGDADGRARRPRGRGVRPGDVLGQGGPSGPRRRPVLGRHRARGRGVDVEPRRRVAGSPGLTAGVVGDGASPAVSGHFRRDGWQGRLLD